MSSTQHQNPFARTSQKTNTQFSLIPGGASTGNNPFSPSKSLIPGGVFAGNNSFSPSKSLISGSVSAGNKPVTTSNPLIPGGTSIRNNPFSPSKSIGESFTSNTEHEEPRIIPTQIETSTVKQSLKVTDILKTKKGDSFLDNIVHQEINSQAKSQENTEILNALTDLSDNLKNHINNVTKLITENNTVIASRLEQIEQTIILLNKNTPNITNKLSEQINNYEIKMKNDVNQLSLQTQQIINSRIQNFNTEWQEKSTTFITEEFLRAMLDTVLNTFKTEVATMIDSRIAHLTEKFSTDNKSLPQQESATLLQSSGDN